MSGSRTDCPYHGSLLCNDRSKCGKCGWNPDIREQRVSRLWRSHPELVSNKVAPCPFCGAEPRVSKLSGFVSIACGNRGCEMAGTGYCSSYGIALRKWNRRVNRVRAGDKK